MTEINSASKQRSRFWKIFANLLKNNIPLNECLGTAGKNAGDELKAVLPDIINEVKQNKNLSDILNDNKTVFTDLEIQVITTGEKYDLFREAKLIKKFKDQLNDNKDESTDPEPQETTTAERNDLIVKCANGLGDIIDKYGFPDNTEEKMNTRSNYWRVFEALINIRNTITKSMKIAADWADIKVREATDQMIEDINNGSDLSSTLRARPEIFTGLEILMVEIGEKTGNLENAINQLPISIKMIEETENEVEKRKNFWKMVGLHEGANFEASDKKMKIFKAKQLDEMLKREKNETNDRIIKTIEETDYLSFRDAIQLALFAADDKLKAISENVLKDIKDKYTLSPTMEKYPDLFQEFETNYITLGESNGNIGQAALDLIEVL